MNAKAMVPLALAVILGLVAALLVRTAMSHKSSVNTGPANLVTVAVAKQDADPGHSLSLEDLTTAKMPADSLPAGVFSDPAQLVGRVSTAPLVKGQTILETLLAPAGSAAGLAALVPPGMRAVTLEVSEFSGVGGMLEPGCRVDVISVMQDLAKKSSVSRTVLQNIKVSAVGRNITPARPVPGQPAPPPSNSVTLLVSPKQAQVLQLATSASRPCLVLRSTRDGVEVPLDSTTVADLQGSGDSVDPTADPAVPTDPQSAQTPVVPTSMDSMHSTNPMNSMNGPSADASPVPAMIRKTITVLNGDAESQVTVMVPNPRAAMIIENDNGYVSPSIAVPDSH